MNFKKSTSFFAFIMILIMLLISSGCTADRYDFEADDFAVELTDKDYKINLEYFTAGRYTSTIVENGTHIFWADSQGIHQLNKNDGTEVLIAEGNNLNSLSVYDDHLYYVEDRSVLHRINLSKNSVESLFDAESHADYLSSINDYTVSDGKIYFLNTFSLFSFDIESKLVEFLDDSSVYLLQVCGNTIYFIDSAEETFTVYAFSMQDKTKKTVIGKAESNPNENICYDFCVANSRMYVFMRCPSTVYSIEESGKKQLLSYYDDPIVSSRAISAGLYYVTHDAALSSVYRYDESEESFMCTLNMMNPATRFSIVNGYVYYNSGVEITVNNSGHASYNYSSAKPTAVKLKA